MAVRPSSAQEAAKSSTVVRSRAAVSLFHQLIGLLQGRFLSGLTGGAGEGGHAVDVQLAALGGVGRWAEVSGSTLLQRRTLLDGGGGGEGCERGEGEGGELHVEGIVGWLVGLERD